MSDLDVTQINTIRGIVEQLALLEMSPLHLRVDAKHVGDTRPDISLWLRYRTDFERFCESIKAKPHERMYRGQGQREWYAESDADTRRLLIQCVSFEHHDDWEPRPKP